MYYEDKLTITSIQHIYINCCIYILSFENYVIAKLLIFHICIICLYICIRSLWLLNTPKTKECAIHMYYHCCIKDSAITLRISEVISSSWMITTVDARRDIAIFSMCSFSIMSNHVQLHKVYFIIKNQSKIKKHCYLSI